jgi:3-oxoacyl-[acyl-carrier protein] reductase
MKVIIVTGDTRGLGLEIVKLLLKNRENVVIGISKSLKVNKKIFTQEQISRYIHINFDLSKTERIKAIFIHKIKKYGKVYGLVNNAAIAYDDLVTNASNNKLDRMLKINLLAPIFFTKFCIRNMILNNIPGSIVHISSISSKTGYKGLSMYAACKGALESFSINVAREWGIKGIRSNCVLPGFMETDMTTKLTSIQKSKIYNRLSLKRPTTINSVAETVVFLLSEKSSSITGETIRVDSGVL